MFCLLTVSSLLLRLLFCHVFFFHVFVCLHSQWMEITDSEGRSQEQGFSPSFPSPSLPLAEMQAVGACLGFPNERLCWGSLESNPAIIAGWSGPGERREGKMNSMLWGFPNPNSLQGLCRLRCAEFYPYLTKHPARDDGTRVENNVSRLSHTQDLWKMLRSGL